MEEDPLFKQRFGISTPIRYMTDVVVDSRCKAVYERAWRSFWRRHERVELKKRVQYFDSFLKRIGKNGDDLPYTKRVAISLVSKRVGYGVFAKEDMAPYSILNHYAGVLKTDRYIPLDNDSTFTFSDFDQFSIEGQKQGNWCRFMNHSPEGSPHTNVVAWEHYSDWGPRIIFTACYRGIKKGDQLLYSYGDDYWKEGKFIEL